MRSQVTTSVARLRPTQITVSMQRVAHTRAHIRSAVARGQLQDFLTWRLFPAVLGPEETVYVIDDHHIPVRSATRRSRPAW